MFRKARNVFAAGAVCLSFGIGAKAVQPARIPGDVDDSHLIRIPHSTHPLAKPQFDQGTAPTNLPMERMLLVLQPDPAKQSELDRLLQAQLDPSSTQYHKWLTPAEFGERFGIADADLAKITGWLQQHGFQIGRIANGRNVIEFSGTAGQVVQAFHTEIHSYLINGKHHWANASDPEIPAALAPVVAGVATLHNFRKASQISNIKPQAVRMQAGLKPAYTASDGSHAISPGDFAIIYNLTGIQSAVNGAGTSIAVVARSNIKMSDIQSFQSAFGVPYTLPQIVINGKDPGDKQDGDEAEAVLDTSWAGALAPDATVKLVISADTNTSDGVDLSEEYIIDNNLADVMTESYGDCEANYTPAEAQFYFSLAQQAAAQGITYTVAAGDSGAEGCDDPSKTPPATGPLSVNLLASTPYNIAIGGTQFSENGSSAYWASSSSSNYVSAFGYIPEVVWNESCTPSQCGSSNAGLWAGGGGASVLVAKPSWQSSVLGIPSDGARDIPDVSFSSASHDAYLLCLDGGCTKKPNGYFSGISGTSAATPSFAAIMALIVQATGSRQGQAAANLYRLAAGEDFPNCVASTPAANCIFNDVVLGNNAVPGENGYGTSAALYQAGVGYDLATGLGSVNVTNLVNSWANSSTRTPGIRIGFDSPSPHNSIVIGVTSFAGWALATSGRVSSISASIDSVPYTNFTYGLRRSDICSLYSSADCPNIGWSMQVDTTMLATGPHQLAITLTCTTGETYTASSTFTVANWTSNNPMKINIDIPGPATQTTFSGVVNFAGWAFDTSAAISQVSIAVDGASYGSAAYGDNRPDVCDVFPGEAGCPNVGWHASVDTTKLADGPHTVTVVAKSAGGQYSAVAHDFIVSNTPSNTIYIAIDAPATQSGPFSGQVGFGGWTLGTGAPITNVSVAVDGIPYGNALYGGNRADACQAHQGAPGCPNVGWNLLFDTTQFVNGQHILTLTASTASGQYATASRLFTVSNTPSTVPFAMSIDMPGPLNPIVFGQTNFAGWVIEPAGSIATVSVAIDGASYGNARYGVSRADACAAVPGSSDCPNVGWMLPVDTNQLASGAHVITITATAHDGRRATLSYQFTVTNWSGTNPMVLSIDRPSPQGGPLSGVTGIGGWVVDQYSAIYSVSIAIDNLPFGFASYGGTRTDVCAVRPGSIGCPNVGWNYLLDTTLLSDGTHTLAVTAITASGRTSTFTQLFQVANHSSSGVQISIDTPTTNQTLTGLAHIGGWAVDPSGAQIVSATVLVDGVVNGIAPYGGTRTDVCAVIPTGGGCPNVGWNYLLDTTPFANGAHTLEIRALSAEGKKYTAAQPFVVANQP